MRNPASFHSQVVNEKWKLEVEVIKGGSGLVEVHS